MFTFLFIQLHISLYNVLVKAFVVVYMLIYGFLELLVLNLNEKEEEKKMKDFCPS